MINKINGPNAANEMNQTKPKQADKPEMSNAKRLLKNYKTPINVILTLNGVKGKKINNGLRTGSAKNLKNRLRTN